MFNGLIITSNTTNTLAFLPKFYLLQTKKWIGCDHKEKWPNCVQFSGVYCSYFGFLVIVSSIYHQILSLVADLVSSNQRLDNFF